ncbi:MAG: Si-specific NAD(P)(+) transhydrogenase [Phycisphaerales bacterium]|nr:Si-specific NAD(P)(+) transhydrogenase [Phycisphaerales bacterium]
MLKFDVCVIGSGPAGQRCAIQAAKLGKTACLIERSEVIGGVAINTGTIPSKSLREAILHLTGFGHSFRTSDSFSAERRITIDDLIHWCQHVVKREIEIVRGHMARNGVQMINGTASLANPRTVVATRGSEVTVIEADRILIATGTKPARPDNLAFDGRYIVDADGILRLPNLPRSLIVVGGGVIGTEYASMMQAVGVKVTLIEGRDTILEFLDPEIREALQYHLRQGGMTLRMGEKVVKAQVVDAPEGARGLDGKLVEATLESGKTMRAECLLYAVGRQGCTSELELERVGLSADNRGRIAVDMKTFQTKVPSIYAAGDVIGFPALASTSMEQGRLAACHMFGVKTNSVPELFPYGIYAIPEISMVGFNEDKLTRDDIPFESGVANYREIARGQLIGDEVGMLKMLIHQETRQILGVHCIGTGATEIVHIGQAVMALKGTVDYFVDTVFNYPTLAECYKVAALNGVNKLAHV